MRIEETIVWDIPCGVLTGKTPMVFASLAGGYLVVPHSKNGPVRTPIRIVNRRGTPVIRSSRNGTKSAADAWSRTPEEVGPRVTLCMSIVSAKFKVDGGPVKKCSIMEQMFPIALSLTEKEEIKPEELSILCCPGWWVDLLNEHKLQIKEYDLVSMLNLVLPYSLEIDYRKNYTTPGTKDILWAHNVEQSLIESIYANNLSVVRRRA